MKELGIESKEAKKENAIKKPLSAYMVFAKENREKFSKGLKPTEIMKKLGEEWQKLTE
jgi:hypothetical protein